MTFTEPVRVSDRSVMRVITGGGGIEIQPYAALVSCPKLSAEEAGCDGDFHELKTSVRTSRRCPLRFYRAERVRLAEELQLCGYSKGQDELTRPIPARLAELIDPTRVDPKTGEPYEGVTEVLPAMRQLRLAGWGRGPHAIFFGTRGTVKTHAILALYFAALWDGCDALWLSSKDFAQMARDLTTGDEVARMRARTRFESWKKRSLLFIDDLGDYVSDDRATGQGSTRAAARLGELMNESSRQRIVSSNLDSTAMKLHPDIGARNEDRLFADRNIDCAACGGSGNEGGRHSEVVACLACDGRGFHRIAALSIKLDGPSQRRVADNLGR